MKDAASKDAEFYAKHIFKSPIGSHWEGADIEKAFDDAVAFERRRIVAEILEKTRDYDNVPLTRLIKILTELEK